MPAGVPSVATSRPGRPMYQDSPVAECCVPKPPAEPPIERTVTGTEHWPPDMKRSRGSPSASASAAVGRKSLNMISTIARMPATAIPAATPTNVFSQIGVLTMRPGKRSGRPSFVLNTPPELATSSPIIITRSSAASSSASAALTAWRYVIVAVSASVDIGARLFDRRVGGLRGEGGGRVDLGLHLALEGQAGLVAEAVERGGEQVERVAMLPALQLALGAISRRVGARVALVAVGLHLQQRRALAGAGARDRRGDRVVDRVDVLAVDDHARHPVALRAIGDVIDRHRVAQRRVLAVEVVLDDEDDRELPGRRHVERLA